MPASLNENLPLVPLRVLMLEESADAAESIFQTLQQAGYAPICERIETLAGMEKALDGGPWEIAILNYHTPGCGALDAIALFQRRKLDIPCIVTSHKMDEQSAVAAMKAGAHDYVLKSNLLRLISAVPRQLREAEHRRQQKREDEDLREAEAMFEALFQKSLDVMLLVDPDTLIIRKVSQTVQHALGYNRDDLIGNPLSALFPPAPGISSDEMLQRLRAHDAVLESQEFLKADGAVRSMDITATLVDWENGKAILVTLRDVTERNKIERYRIHSQKLEAIGRLAGGVAHDFNNILMVIGGYANLLMEQLTADEGSRHKIEQINRAVDRASAMTRHLLAFSRKHAVALQILNLNTIIHGSEEMLQRLIGEDIQLIKDCTDGLWNVKADPVHMDQMLMNLAINARDAMPRGGKLILKTENVEIKDRSDSTFTDVAPGSYMMLTITDTGSGMSDEVLFHLFEPFFTTKGKGKGTGLGLSTVYGIVKQCNGHILVTSKPGDGSSFRILLPRETEAAESIPVDTLKPPRVGGTETILLVEDQHDVRELARSILVANGYNVLAAQDARDALHLLYKQQHPIDLLLSDVIMPGMNGVELAVILLSSNPRLKVLLMSGYTDDKLPVEMMSKEAFTLMVKPVMPELLLRKVRETIDTPAVSKKL